MNPRDDCITPAQCASDRFLRDIAGAQHRDYFIALAIGAVLILGVLLGVAWLASMPQEAPVRCSVSVSDIPSLGAATDAPLDLDKAWNATGAVFKGNAFGSIRP